MKTYCSLLLVLLISVTAIGQLHIKHLTGGLYVYSTYKNLAATTIPSNGMYLVTENQVVLIDTPWDPEQFQPLLDSIEAKHHKPVTTCIVTHYHADRTAALPYYNAKGISSWSSILTYTLGVQNNIGQADNYFYRDTIFTIDNYAIETYYPGPGHTDDNIVIWFAADNVLYAGCLVKSKDYKILGNSPDSDMSAWYESLRKVMKKFPAAQFVVPGHFSWGDKSSFTHTIKLIKEKRRER